MCYRDNTNVNEADYGGVSPQLDDLTSTLMGDALDLLAEGMQLNVLLVMQTDGGKVESYEFADDSPEHLLQAAYEHVRRERNALYYAIAYEGAVEMDDGTYADALILEFGERGRPSFSAYSLFEGRGTGEQFAWTDAAPAGEVEALLG